MKRMHRAATIRERFNSRPAVNWYRNHRDSLLEPDQGLQVTKPRILAFRIDGTDPREALCVAQVTGQGEARVHPVIDAGVVQVGERPPAGGVPSRVTKRPRLKSAAAAVPEVGRLGQTKGMEFRIH